MPETRHTSEFQPLLLRIPGRSARSHTRNTSASSSRPQSASGHDLFTPSISRATSPGRDSNASSTETVCGPIKCPECGSQLGTTDSQETDDLVRQFLGLLLSHTIWYFAHLICIFAHCGVLIDCLIIDVTSPSKVGRPKILIGAYILAAAAFTSNIFAFLYLVRVLPQKELSNNVWLQKKTVFMVAWLQKFVLIIVDFCVLGELLNALDFIEDDQEVLLRSNPRFSILAILFIVAGSTAIICFLLDWLSFMRSWSAHRKIFGRKDLCWQRFLDL